ncbi:hypothetical protein PHMEG_0006477 [Phytophthora megakarya]|uniref:Uncharacterized protein n=1 Tax=Phytophthora megakarya TaxID=4795 RepID=A0A225WP30_9STRA|nr:hypothetical protein PHMEG_0006477 [Phytophthora megakarya]
METQSGYEVTPSNAATRSAAADSAVDTGDESVAVTSTCAATHPAVSTGCESDVDAFTCAAGDIAVSSRTQSTSACGVAPDEPTSKRQKVEGDIRGGTVSYLLSVEQHRHMLKLYHTFPSWPARTTAVPELTVHNKWIAIAAEMKACFPDLTVEKSSLRNVLYHKHEKQKYNELVAFKREHEHEEVGACKVDTKKLQQENAVLQKMVKVLKEESLEIRLHFTNKSIDNLAKMKQVVDERTERTQELDEANAKIDVLLEDLENLNYEKNILENSVAALQKDYDNIKSKNNKLTKKNAFLTHKLECVHADWLQSLRDSNE